MPRAFRLALASVVVFVAACSDSGSLTPSTPTRTTSTTSSHVLSCSTDTAQVRALLTQAFSNSPDKNSVLGKWNNIQHQVSDLHDVTTGQAWVFDLVGFILAKNRQNPLPISTADFASLLNQLYCFVGLDAHVTDPNNTWIIHPGDPVTTLVTSDSHSGIQFTTSAVNATTLVTAGQGSAPLTTLLDKYPFVLNWTLTPTQTLTTQAIIGICPNIASLPTNLSTDELTSLLDRLVLGHQASPTDVDILPHVTLPPEMALNCGSTPSSIQASWGKRLLNTLAAVFLPETAHADVRRLNIGGVGGSTSEFSPFEPLDPMLTSIGGVGGSTSEFIRTGPAASLMTTPATVDGTVGTTRTTGLPSVTIQTAQGTPIPGVGVAFATGAPATSTPVGNATTCGADAATNAQGTAALTCLNFGTTTQYRKAYTKLSATFTLPAELAGLDAQGNPVVTIAPAKENWLIASFGPSSLVFTQPPAGRTGANAYSADDNVPARVEIRSDLGDVVSLATNPVTIKLNQNTFFGGGNTATANAVAGVAAFSKQIATAAAGYQFTGSATLSNVGLVTSTTGSNLFDVMAGTAAKISVVGTADYGSVTTNPVSPSPKVLVTDNYNNIKSGALVYWTPGGATGALANGSMAQSTNSSAADGTTSALWQLGEGDNVLRASLQSATGGAEVFFTASHTATYSVIDACVPGGAKDDISAYYFGIPGPVKTTGLLHSIGVYLSATGSVGQTNSAIGYPMTMLASRTYKNSSNVTVTQNFTSNATAFLRGDNGSSGDRVVTFLFDIPPVSDLGPGAKQPDVTVQFQIPAGGYARTINFNAGQCGPGKCSPPSGCDASEYKLPISSSNAVYRKSVALIVKGR